MSESMRQLDAAVFFLRDGEQARHSKVVAHIRDRVQTLLDALDAGTPIRTRGGGNALHFSPEQADRLIKARDALRGAV